MRNQSHTRGVLWLSAALALACSSDPETPTGGAGASAAGTAAMAGAGATTGDAGMAGHAAGSSSGGSAGGSSSATVVPFADHFEEAPAGAAAGDAKFAQDFCGDPADSASLKPVGTVVRVPKSLRYFVCIGSLGATSADLIQTNIPSDPQQGFIPYGVLFTYQDPGHPNVDRPSNGPLNYALLVINLLDSYANSRCSGSNATFDDLKIGGAKQQLCSGVASTYREDGDRKYVDVTFPSGAQQSFLLSPIPYEPPP
jgi:hypothetical protein